MLPNAQHDGKQAVGDQRFALSVGEIVKKAYDQEDKANDHIQHAQDQRGEFPLCGQQKDVLNGTHVNDGIPFHGAFIAGNDLYADGFSGIFLVDGEETPGGAGGVNDLIRSGLILPQQLHSVYIYPHILMEGIDAQVGSVGGRGTDLPGIAVGNTGG